MLLGILVVIFVFVCVVLTLLVLVQSDKGGGISGAIGGGLANANSVMGAQNTENILSRGTVVFAVLYIVLTIVISLGVAKIEAGKVQGSSIQKVLNNETGEVPVK